MTEETRWEALERVAKEASENANPAPPELPDKLPLNIIELEENVFQQRGLDGPLRSASMGHLEKLAEAIRRSPTHTLDPVTVWWSGSRWIVVDGHHRLEAYRTVAQDPKKPITDLRVPVEPVVGPLDEAIRRSAQGNVKNNLNMSEEEKSDMAWRFTCWGANASPPWRKRQIAIMSDRSESTVANMRRTRKSLVEKIETGEVDEVTEPGLMEMRWDEAQRLDRGEPARDWSEERLDKVAQAMAVKLRKAFKDTPSKSPALFARALLYYDPELPKYLIEAEPWWEVHKEIEEEKAEYEDDEGTFRDF